MSSVSLKGNKYGLSVSISRNASFDEIKEDTAKSFQFANKMFGNEQIAIGFEGRLLSNYERDELLDIVRSNCDLDIVCVMDFSLGTEERFKKAVETFSEPVQEEVPESNISDESSEISSPEPEVKSDAEPLFSEKEPEAAQSTDIFAQNPGIAPEDLSKIAKFYKGNVRSGVVINEDSSLIILGDVSIGGEVISKGNIIVLGALRGNAFAGSEGNENCFVAALTMNPMQVRIGDIMARCGDKGNSKEEHEPEIAFVKNNTIAIELINRTVLNDINL